MFTLLSRTSMKAFIAGVFAMGVLRFLLTIAGIPDQTVKYFSMTAVIAVGALYFALQQGPIEKDCKRLFS